MPFDAFGRARSQKYLVGSRLRAKRPKGEALARGAAPGKILVPHSRSTRLRRMIDNPAHVSSKAMLWTGRVISAIPVIFMMIGGFSRPPNPGGEVARLWDAGEPFFFQSSLAFSRGSVSCCAMRESVRFFP